MNIFSLNFPLSEYFVLDLDQLQRGLFEFGRGPKQREAKEQKRDADHCIKICQKRETAHEKTLAFRVGDC